MSARVSAGWGLTLGMLALGGPLSGCDKKEAPTAATAAAPVASAPPTTPIPDSDIRVSEDFEETAEKQIGDKDYRNALDSIEKELATSSP